MRKLLPKVLLVVPALALAAGGPTPTVIYDIHAVGATRVTALKKAPGVVWSAEFGNELLLGVAPESLAGWLENKHAKPGPADLAFDEVVVRDHVCTLHDDEPALFVVGGHEIVRKSPSLAKATRGPALAGEPLPENGVVSRELNNQRRQKGTAAPVAPVQNLLARIDPERWFSTMSELSAFNRNSFNPGLIDAHDWVLQRFADAGLSTESFAFNMSVSTSTCSSPPKPVTAYNPIGVKRGETLPNEWIIVGAHYDSRNVGRCDWFMQPQPGANDNASGCAGVIELARVFAGQPTARSMLFMCFAGEEQALVGSSRYTTQLINSGDMAKVKHMLNLDMIGHAVDDTLSALVETQGSFSASVLALYQDANLTYAPELNLITRSSTIAYSDHWFFLQAGVPAAFTWENGAGIYPQYHRFDDLPANMQRARPLAHGILKMDAAVLADLAMLLPLFADGFED